MKNLLLIFFLHFIVFGNSQDIFNFEIQLGSIQPIISSHNLALKEDQIQRVDGDFGYNFSINSTVAINNRLNFIASLAYLRFGYKYEFFDLVQSTDLIEDYSRWETSSLSSNSYIAIKPGFRYYFSSQFFVSSKISFNTSLNNSITTNFVTNKGALRITGNESRLKENGSFSGVASIGLKIRNFILEFQGEYFFQNEKFLLPMNVFTPENKIRILTLSLGYKF